MGVFDRTDHLAGAGHEQVVFCQDPASGLKAIIAIWSTALGPALGGTRFHPYASEDDALADVLKLSRAMAYKAAVAGLDLGGGKAVILGDPATDKSEPLLRAFGRYVQSLGGRYWTACDVGTSVPDMDVIARESRFVTGRSPEQGGAGDSAVLTAYGVFQAMRAAAEQDLGRPDARRPAGRRRGGRQGRRAARRAPARRRRLGRRERRAARGRGAGPCRLAAGRGRRRRDAADLRPRRLRPLRARRLAHRRGGAGAQGHRGLRRGQQPGRLPGLEQALHERGVLYVPDYVANGGGLIQVGDEALHAGSGGFRFERAQAAATGILDTTRTVLRRAAADGVPPTVAADAVAEARMAQVSRLRSITLPA